MLARSLTRRYQVPAPPTAVWDYLTDPVAVAAAAAHPVLVAKPTPGFGAGTRWDEIHDDECDFDSVPWLVLSVEPGESFTVEGLQSGARQRVTTHLRAIGDGTEVIVTMELRPCARAPGTALERVLLFGICVTGLGMSVVAEEFDRAVAADREHLRSRTD